MRRLLALLLLATSLSLTTYAAAAEAASARLTLSGPKTATVGKAVTLNGTTTLRPGTKVLLQKRVDGRWRTQSAARVGTAHRFRFRVNPTVGTHSYRAAAGRAASPRKTLTITRQRCRLSARASHIPADDGYAIYGRLTGCRAASSVLLQQWRSARWQTLSSQRPDRSGRVEMGAAAHPNTVLRLLKRQDRQSTSAVSPKLAPVVQAGTIDVDGPPVTLQFGTERTHWLKFQTSATSVAIHGDLDGWWHLYRSDGREVRPWIGGESSRYDLTAGTYYLRIVGYSPEGSVGVVAVPIRAAEIGGPEVSFPALTAPVHRYVRFTGKAGQLITVSKNLRLPILRTSRGTLVDRYGDSGNDLWRLPADGTYEIDIHPSEGDEELTIGIPSTVEHQARIGDPTMRIEFTRPRQIQVFRFDAEQGATLRIRQSGPNEREHWMVVDPNGEIHSDTFNTDDTGLALNVKAAGPHSAIMVPYGDATGPVDFQVCAANEARGELDGEVVRIQDSADCPARQIIVNFHADAGDKVGVTEGGPPEYRGCFVRDSERRRIGACALGVVPISTTGDHQMVFYTAGSQFGALRLWRASQAMTSP